MNIYLLEDSLSIKNLITRSLKIYGYKVNAKSSKFNISPSVIPINYELLILNTKLRFKNSIEFCRKIREDNSNIYILGINTKGNWQNKVDFLNSGGDDCISFPFPMEELLARIQTLLRRPQIYQGNQLQHGSIVVDPYKRDARIFKEKLDLSKTEYNLLEYLIRNKERTVTRSELLDRVWDYKRITNSNTVDVHITKLRKKINKCYKNENNTKDLNFPIKTVYGVGYKLQSQETS